MRLTATLCLALGAIVVAALWAGGGFAALGWWAQAQQRTLQAALAGEVAALRAGETAALWGLIGLCGAYGFVHALGPGHGKALIAGAAIGTRATAQRMAGVALAGSLAQALVAILLVYGGFVLLDVTARALTEGAERWLGSAGNAAVAAVGAWILLRGLRGLRTRGGEGRLEDRHRRPCSGCGHAHGPSPDQVAGATSLAATLGLVAAMAARPCTGALFVLVIAWRMGLPGAGAAAVLAMGLGTAAFTALVAWLAVTSREAAFLSVGDRASRLGPALQIVTGGFILAASGLLVLAALPP